jgi:hypothetical protein
VREVRRLREKSVVEGIYIEILDILEISDKVKEGEGAKGEVCCCGH